MINPGLRRYARAVLVRARQVLVLCLLAGPLAAPAPASAGPDPVRPDVVGGTQVSAADVPWQVALVRAGQTAAAGQFCGGVILSATRIATAAHCVAGRGGSDDPDTLRVLAGTTFLSTVDDAAQWRDVASLTVDPAFDSGVLSHDAAVLTLSAPLALDALGTSDLDAGTVRAAAIPLSPSPPSDGAAVSVSGWGDTSFGTQAGSDALQRADLAVLPDADASCGPAYTDFDPATMLCAGAAGRDSCQGDSGGPLVSGSGADAVLVGLVSSGERCADPGFAGIYTDVSAPAVRAFLLAPGAPVPGDVAPALDGPAVVGSTLTCSPGSWNGATGDFRYTFIDGFGLDLRPDATHESPALTLSPADVGRTVRCVVTAANAAGSTAAPPTAAIGPVTAPVPAPVPPAVPPPTPPAPARADVSAPVALLATRRCAGGHCTLRIRVRDDGVSSGVAGISATVTSAVRTRCRRGGRTVVCVRARSRTLPVTRTGLLAFTITATLPYGPHVLTLSAIDFAGNRQARATAVRFTTVKPARPR